MLNFIAIIAILFWEVSYVRFFAIAAFTTIYGGWYLAIKIAKKEEQQLQQQKEKELAKSNEDTVAGSSNQPGHNVPVGPIFASEPEIVPEISKPEIVTPESGSSLVSVLQKPQKIYLKHSSSVQRRKQKRELRELKAKLKDKHVLTASEIKCLSYKTVTPILEVRKELKCFVRDTAKILDPPVPHNLN